MATPAVTPADSPAGNAASLHTRITRSGVEQGVPRLADENLPLAKPAPRLAPLDALRGAAALAVLIHHAINYGQGDLRLSGDMPLHSTPFLVIWHVLDLGSLGVALFFVLSGFCIHYRCASGFTRTGRFDVDASQFLRRRFIRLYPSYLVALTGSMSLLLAAYLIGKSTYTLQRYGDNPLPTMGLDFGLHATMLHGASAHFWKSGGNAVYWTLALECYFYLLYVPLLAVRRRIGAWNTLAAAALVSVATGWIAELTPSLGIYWQPWLRDSLPTLWCQWILGLVLAEAYVGVLRLPRWMGSPMAWAAAIGAALGVQAFVPPLAPLAWGAAFALLLHWCLNLESANRWPAHRVVKWLASVGVFSYSLYLVNLPVRSSVRWALPGLTRTTNLLHYLAVALVITVAGYWAGKLFFLMIERHFLITPSRRGPVVAAHPLPLPITARSDVAA